MKITYPPLVEQAYSFAISVGANITKQEMYKLLVKDKMIDENGNPTKKAIKEGLVEDVNINTSDPIHQTKLLYPDFAFIPDKCFIVKNNEVYLDAQGIRMFCNSILSNPDSTPKEIQKARTTLEKIKDWN